MEWQHLLERVKKGDVRALSRSISFVENEQPGYQQLLAHLPQTKQAKIIGITGPPGAGKSTLTDGLIREMVQQQFSVGVLCVDPSSPFNLGAVLGDRIRMSEWYLHPAVFIRSLATRGAMGGLHPKIMEIAELLKATHDFVIIETVGVGQSEVEIAGLADATVVVLVPEAGDDVQAMKAGLMEIADVFVVNKSDRPDADAFVNHLRKMLAPTFQKNPVPVIKTIASKGVGLQQLFEQILNQLQKAGVNERQYWLLAEKAWHIIQKQRMRNVSKAALKLQIQQLSHTGSFNLYQFVQQFET